MKPKSEKKLQEWAENARRKGLNPEDIKLYINEDGPEQPPNQPISA